MGFTEDREARQRAYQDAAARRRGDYQLKQYLSTLPLDQRQQYLKDQSEVTGEESPFQPIATKPVSQPRSAGAAVPMIVDDPFAYVMAQGERFAKATNDAIRDEMDRRVSISREQRRMEYELAKKRMEEETKRQETAAQYDALLKRLNAENGITTIYH